MSLRETEITPNPQRCVWCDAVQPGPRAAREAGWLQPSDWDLVHGRYRWGATRGSFLCNDCQQEAQESA